MFKHLRFSNIFLPILQRKLIRLRWNVSLRYKTNMRVLNVAEKNDAAKNIAGFLSGGLVTRREGLSKFNKIYEFECDVFGQHCKMIMTSVAGHLLTYDFVGNYRSWKGPNPISLFEAPVERICPPENVNIKKTLEREVNSCTKLIIWTDCDREGEGIGFEIIDVCKAIKPQIAVYRAKFSEITFESVKRALRNLEAPNKHISDAVSVRQELDLRIGAAFTRFQTLHLKKAFPNALSESLVSYGSCQFPTLGFVVERFKAISEFIPEKFWKINVNHTVNELSVDFEWKRNRLFHKLACEVLYDKCKESGTATVENVQSKPKTKWRPRPLDTVELEKLASRKLKINAKETLRIAEKLYTQGFISYPRTETNIFPKELNLVPLVECQTSDASWGEFADKVLRNGPNPFQGNKSDQAHPPIHPIKYTNNLSGNEQKIYHFIVRHFLACLSKHAEGLETTVDIDIASEKFVGRGLMITAKNYLEVYPYEKWNDKEIHIYRKGDTFKPEISLGEGETSPPELLTEADLIALMEKHGIGTDATHADHIETIKARLYVGLKNEKYFIPRTLGMGLVEGYNTMGYAMARPELRAELEADLKRICENQKSAAEVLSHYIKKYKEVYEGVQRQVNCLFESIQTYIQVEATHVEPDQVYEINYVVRKCVACKSDMILRTKKDDKKYVGCSAFPRCRSALWFPSFVKDATVGRNTCPKCGSNIYLVQFQFEKGSCYLPSNYEGCLNGCDLPLLEILNSDNSSRAVYNRSNSLPTSTEISTNSGSSTEFSSNSLRTSNEILDLGEELRCYCAIPCRRLTVVKDGPNKGRGFYTCGKNQRDSDRCNFFKWAENDENTFNNSNRMTENYNNRNVTIGRNNVPNNQTQVKKRKCGICGQEGHNRKNCPRR